ncbi:MAG: hypothetical protein WBP81_34880 [Solirubrobacteraceae bacterium]
MPACDGNVYTENPASTDIENSYGIAKISISSDHIENSYSDGAVLTVNHDTLVNPVNQTAVIFANTNGGSGGACSNHLTITNNLIGGGGYTFYPCGNASSAGSAKNTITGNRFARCITTPVAGAGGIWHCSGGGNKYGYWPFSGDFGQTGRRGAVDGFHARTPQGKGH